MELTELIFKVNTEQLKQAQVEISNLKTAVQDLEKTQTQANNQTEASTKSRAKAEADAGKAMDQSGGSTKKATNLLERHNDIVAFMTQGYSRGQSSVLAMAKASGMLADDIKQLGDVLQTQRTLMGTDPFDKSIGAMQALRNEYTVLKDVMRQYNDGSELSKKQMVDLAREKLRLIAAAKTESASLSDIKSGLRALESAYNQNVTAENKLAAAAKAKADALISSAQASSYLEHETNKLVFVNQQLERGFTVASSNTLYKYKQALEATGASANEVRQKLYMFEQDLMKKQGTSPFAKLHADVKTLDRSVNHLARNVGVQFTDIFTSLANGQPVFQVVTQQGGQLADAFLLAGISADNMSKHLLDGAKAIFNSYKLLGIAFLDLGKVALSSLTNTLTSVWQGVGKLTTTAYEYATGSITATRASRLWKVQLGELAAATAVLSKVGIVALVATLAGLAKGLYDVYQEEKQLSQQFALTGATMGSTGIAAALLTKQMEQMGASSTLVTSALVAIAKDGSFTRDEIQLVADTAIVMQKKFGIAADETVKSFAKIKDKPVEALIELAKQTGLVDTAIIRNVHNLKEQGDKAGATALAMTTLADVNSQQVKRLKEDQSELAKALTGMWETFVTKIERAMRSLWRKLSPEEALKQQLSSVQDQIQFELNSNPDQNSEVMKNLEKQEQQIRNQLKLLEDRNVQEAETARLRKVQADSMEAELKQIEKNKKFFESKKQTTENEYVAAQIEEYVKSVGKAAVNVQTLADTEKRARLEWRESHKAKTEAMKLEDKYQVMLKNANSELNKALGITVKLSNAQVNLANLKTTKEWKALSPDQQKVIEGIYAQADATERLNESEKVRKQQLAVINSIQASADYLGKDYYKTLQVLDEALVDGNISLDDYITKLNELYKISANFKNFATITSTIKKEMEGVGAKRVSVKAQYEADFQPDSVRKSLENKAKLEKEYSDIEAQQNKDIEDAKLKVTGDSYTKAVEQYKALAEERKRLAKEVYDREEYLNSESFRRMQKYSDSFQKLFSDMGNALADFVLDGKNNFGDLVNSMLKDLFRFEMQMMTTNMYKSMGGSSGIISAIGSLFTASANGNVFDDGKIKAYATGGVFTNSVVTSPTFFNNSVMGEAGPEAIMPLKRGPDGSLGVVSNSSAGGSSVDVVINNYSNTQATATETTDSRGNRRIEVTIGDMVSGELNRSGSSTQKSMGSTFGIRPQLISR